ncbi:MAG: peptidase M61 [Burkholderiaceae bacterium]|nr:peptidase M61 [Burkholderiaceae bacterium]
MQSPTKSLLALTLGASLAVATTLCFAANGASFPGTIQLNVDLRDAPRHIFRVKEILPVKEGKLKLSFPKWIPGEHGPTGPVDGVTGLKLSVSGNRVAWRRDLEDTHSILLDVPEGARDLQLEFEFLSPVAGGNFGAGVSATPRLMMLEWNQVVFYPNGFQGDQITLSPSIKLPKDWQFATALEMQSSDKNGIQFKAVSLNDLVDSPLAAGRYNKKIDLAPNASKPVFLNLFSDREENLSVSDAQIKHHKNLVMQARALFGAEHYDSYQFLLLLSKETNHFGLEHHQSSDNRANADFFTSPTAYMAEPTLLPHEYVHSWNGKFRRPIGLATGNFSSPMKADLLWIYEGLTNYLGEVLTARAGMWSPDQYRERLAITAADMDHRPGRGWRPLQDTADHAQILYNAPQAWANYRRSVDFYPEGSLVWLDIDTQIRASTEGKKSLDDFIRIFFADDINFSRTSHDVKPYLLEEVIETLNKVVIYDWTSFIQTRLTATSERAPLDGISRGGWRLIYDATPSEMVKADLKESKLLNLMYSLGFIATNEGDHEHEPGEVVDVLWNSPAFEAGLTPGMKILAIDGEIFDPETINFILKRAQQNKQPIELLVKNLSYFSTLKIQYTDGPKYPRLVRVENSADWITPIATPK